MIYILHVISWFLQIWVDEVVSRSESVVSWNLASQKSIDIAAVHPFLLLLLFDSLTLPGGIYLRPCYFESVELYSSSISMKFI